MAKALARDRYGVGRYRSDRPITADKGPKELAQIIEDSRSGKRYLRGRFLGKVRLQASKSFHLHACSKLAMLAKDSTLF